MNNVVAVPESNYAIEMAELAAAEADFFDATNVAGFMLELQYLQTSMSKDPSIPVQISSAINTMIGDIESEIPGASSVPPNIPEMTAAIQAMFPNQQPNAVAQSILQTLQNMYGIFQALGS